MNGVPWKRKQQEPYAAQERRISGKKKSRPQINSGRLWHSLRDVGMDTPIGRVLIDCKTGKDGPLNSYRLVAKDWSSLKRDASRTPPGCSPALQIDLGSHKLWVVEEAYLDELVKRAANAA